MEPSLLTSSPPALTQPIGPIDPPSINSSKVLIVDNVQSHSLSEKQKKLFTKLDFINDHLAVYIYKGKDSLRSLEITRYAIVDWNMPAANNNCYPASKLIGVEDIVFWLAMQEMKDKLSAESTIKNRVSTQATQSDPLTFPNNVCLVDIFATVKDKATNELSIREDEKKKGIAETHTICLWKKTDTQFMIIDPSSSLLSERLQNSVQSLLQEVFNSDIKCNIVEHPDGKFYTLPEKSSFVSKSLNSEKLRDCIDIALKIGIVLNEGAILYHNPYEVQNSINLLSNQSSVNPVLGGTNDSSYVKRLQSTRRDRRLAVIHDFSCIPTIFKQFFNYSAWLAFQKLKDEKQVAILKALTFFNKEIVNSNFLADKKAKFELQFERLEKLSTLINRYTSLKKELQDAGEGEVAIKLKSNSFAGKK